MTKRMIKLSFKRWRWYLRPKMLRWLRDCNAYMNSDEVKQQIEEGEREIVNSICLGINTKSIEDARLNSKVCLVVEGKTIRELHPDWGRRRKKIVDYFVPIDPPLVSKIYRDKIADDLTD